MSRIELTKKWWTTNRPKAVKGIELERALIDVEEAGDEERVAALGSLPGAITKATRELDKKEHKELLKALDTLATLAETERKKLETQAKAAAAKAKAEAAEKEKTEDEQEEEETPEDKLFDPVFQISILKRAIKKPLVFAFAIGSKPEQSLLAVNARGNPKNLMRLARTRSGSPKGCCGQAQAAEDDPKTLILSLDGPLVGGLARSVRKYFQANKIRLFRKIRVLVDGQEAESDVAEEELPPEAAAAAAPASKAAPAEEPSAPLTEKQLQVLDDRRQEFKRARAAWVNVKTKAEMDLEKVKDGAHELYAADAQQFPKIVRGCKEIDTILDNLDDELRDTLDQYASTPLKNQAKLHALAATANEVLDRYRKYVEGNAVLKAIDMKEFADVTMHAPIMKALNDLRKALV
jgi:hypothetical protein